MAIRKKKKEKKNIIGGLAVAGMGIALMSGMGAGGGSTLPGKPVTAWMRNNNGGTLIIVTRSDFGAVTDTVGDIIISSDAEEYRMTTFRTQTPYYVYGQEESTRISSVEFGTVLDGTIDPANTSTFDVMVNGSVVGTKAVLPSITLTLSTFNLIATVEFMEAPVA